VLFLQALAIIGFALLCLGVEVGARKLGFPSEPAPFRHIYWLMVAIMTLLGVMVVLASPLLLLSILPALWMSIAYPSRWRQIQQHLERHGHSIGITIWELLPGLALLVGGLLLCWPALRVWLSA
jgi:hypothetical protein